MHINKSKINPKYGVGRRRFHNKKELCLELVSLAVPKFVYTCLAIFMIFGVKGVGTVGFKMTWISYVMLKCILLCDHERQNTIGLMEPIYYIA